jgi:O-antigen/teichoic acid export membrane protein
MTYLNNLVIWNYEICCTFDCLDGWIPVNLLFGNACRSWFKLCLKLVMRIIWYLLAIKRMPTHMLVAASAWGSRAITAGTQLLSIPYLYGALGADAYSAFALLGGLAAWSSLFDFGVGNSLQNYISERRAQGKSYSPLIATAALMAGVGILLFGGIVYISSPDVAVIYLRSANYLSDENKTLSFEIVALMFICGSLGGVLYKGWFAIQRGWLANIFSCAGALFGWVLIMMFDVSSFERPLFMTLILYYGPQSILSLFVLLVEWFRYKRSLVVGELKCNVKILLARGKDFWIFAVMAALVLQADYLVMSQKLQSGDIVLYALLSKVFGLILFVYSAVLQALWPECAELFAKGRFADLKQIARKYVVGGVFGVALIAILFLALRGYIMNLVAKGIYVPIETAALFGVYVAIRVWTDTYAMLLQSMNVLKPLWVMVPVQAILSIGLQWILSGWYGINGMLVGLIVSFLFTVSAGIPYIFYSRLRCLSGSEIK